MIFTLADPFVLSHNLGAGLSLGMVKFIRSTFEKARDRFGTARQDIPVDIQARQRFFFDTSILNDGLMPPTGRNCNICGKIGHWAKQCAYNKSRRDKAGNDQQNKAEKSQQNKRDKSQQSKTDQGQQNEAEKGQQDEDERILQNNPDKGLKNKNNEISQNEVGRPQQNSEEKQQSKDLQKKPANKVEKAQTKEEQKDEVEKRDTKGNHAMCFTFCCK